MRRVWLFLFLLQPFGGAHAQTVVTDENGTEFLVPFMAPERIWKIESSSGDFGVFVNFGFVFGEWPPVSSFFSENTTVGVKFGRKTTPFLGGYTVTTREAACSILWLWGSLVTAVLIGILMHLMRFRARNGA